MVSWLGSKRSILDNISLLLDFIFNRYIEREQLFVHSRICAFVLSVRQQNHLENNKNTEDTIQWESFPNVLW